MELYSDDVSIYSIFFLALFFLVYIKMKKNCHEKGIGQERDIDQKNNQENKTNNKIISVI